MNYFFLLLCLLLSSCSHSGSYDLTLVHMNDTHSHLEPVAVNLTIGGEKTVAELGGFARIKTAVDMMRRDDPSLLLLHSGDAVQGTLYFTLMNGGLEYEFMNLLGVDAMTFGNHEFDRGLGPIPAWINGSNFPWLSANIDFSEAPDIGQLVKPHLVKVINGEQIGLIGITSESALKGYLGINRIKFKPLVESIDREVAGLASQGINKIVLVTHLGYENDKVLATRLSGVDIIVGGHSHTLLGDGSDLALLGLKADGSYPTEMKDRDGKPVLVLQAWQWGQMLGNIKVTFTGNGEVERYSSRAVMPMGESFRQSGKPVSRESKSYRDIVKNLEKSKVARIVEDNRDLVSKLEPFAEQLAKFNRVPVATATNDLIRGVNSGPGPLAADSMLGAAANVRVAILNYGAVRKDFAAGIISVGDILEAMPFANTLVQVDLTGEELQQALEDDIDFLITKFGETPEKMPYLSGALLTVLTSAPKGSRVTKLAVKDQKGDYQPIDKGAVYRTIVNSFIANGGDGFTVIKNAVGSHNDTGLIDSDVFREHLKNLSRIGNPGEQRVIVR